MPDWPSCLASEVDITDTNGALPREHCKIYYLRGTGFKLSDLWSTLGRIATQFALAVSKLRVANSQDGGALGLSRPVGSYPYELLGKNDLDRLTAFSDPEWLRKWNTLERLISLDLFLNCILADCVFRHRNDGPVCTFSEDEPYIASRLAWLPIE